MIVKVPHLEADDSGAVNIKEDEEGSASNTSSIINSVERLVQ